MSNDFKILSELSNIRDLLMSSDTYFIPDFQRDFVWTAADVEQLFNDFKEDTNNFSIPSSELEGYLLGNIVLIKDPSQPNQRIVVDGQQRLTTLSLISLALLQHLSSSSNIEKNSLWIELQADLNKSVGEIDLSCYDDSDTAPLRYRNYRINHDTSHPLFRAYRDLVLTNETTCAGVSVDNLVDVFETAKTQIALLNRNQLINFTDYFKNVVKIIKTTTPTESKAFQLFEVLNDRGHTLEPMDLIKNHFLKYLSSAQYLKDDFNTKWKTIIDYLNSSPSKSKTIKSSTFFKHFTAFYWGELVQAKQLFDFIKSRDHEFNNRNNLINFINCLVKSAEYYSALVYDEAKSNPYLNNDINKINYWILFKLLQYQQTTPLLLVFADSEDRKKNIILDTCVRMAASLVFSSTQSNYIEKELPTLIKKYREEASQCSEDAFNNLIDSLENITSSCAKKALSIVANHNYVNSKGNQHDKKALTLLKFIEIYFNENPLAMDLSRKKITVEHILPQSYISNDTALSALGFYDKKDLQDNIHRLGNLTLLANTDNSSASNATFAEKKDYYENSDFRITKAIVSPLETPVKKGMDSHLFSKINSYTKQYDPPNGLWSKSEIEARSMDIANLLFALLTNKANLPQN